eukprot:jgi/Chlat1/1028/Chrsp109S00045
MDSAEQQAQTATAPLPTATPTNTTTPPHVKVGLAVLQVVQLAVVLFLLILLPWLLFRGQPGGAAVTSLRPICLYISYLIFFTAGTLLRIIRHGQLADRKTDAQRKSPGGRLQLLSFILAVPTLHWKAMWDYCFMNRVRGDVTITGGVLVLCGTCVNAWAAWHLRENYDRVVKPESLITSGPYALVRHPIYLSYIMLFVGYATVLGSNLAACGLAIVCELYYARRMRLEEAILEEAFGEAYGEYKRQTPGRLLPMSGF